jgi:hypothetical protein
MKATKAWPNRGVGVFGPSQTGSGFLARDPLAWFLHLTRARVPLYHYERPMHQAHGRHAKKSLAQKKHNVKLITLTHATERANR